MPNILQDVQTYQISDLALLSNANCFIGTANTEFNEFNKIPTNLGQTVTFDSPVQLTSNAGLVAVDQDLVQNVHSLTVDQARNVTVNFTDQEWIFNVERYMKRYGRPAVGELGASIEENVARNSLVPFRFFGDGINPINSFGQLGSMLADFRSFGAVYSDTYVYLSLRAESDIVNTGANQFVPSRNEKMANSWMVGDFDQATFCRSNLLPVHIAGNAAQNGTNLIIAARPTTTQLVLSGFGFNDPDAVKENDLFTVQSDLFFRTYQGKAISPLKVQFRATIDSVSDGGGNALVNISYPLIQPSDGDPQKLNLSRDINLGVDNVLGVPSHRRGMVCSGGGLFLAMPQLPTQEPYFSANESDPDTGISMRLSFGSDLNNSTRRFIHSAIWGSSLVPQYAMSIVFPLTQ
ncbi:hypothetical protein [Flavobacterium sp.]|uniref:hypothetical protein n=1 Tax=Flavobacterium sp. TaxID=239 RepID=UPI003F6A3BFE